MLELSDFEEKKIPVTHLRVRRLASYKSMGHKLLSKLETLLVYCKLEPSDVLPPSAYSRSVTWTQQAAEFPSKESNPVLMPPF